MVTEGIQIPRRRVLDFLLGGSILGMLGNISYPVFRYLMPSKIATTNVGSVRAAKVAEVKHNSGKIFRFGNEPDILIRTPSGELRAFNAIRTHLSCTVQYRPDFKHIWCACHNGHFDLYGKNIAGPPARGIRRQGKRRRRIYLEKGLSSHFTEM